VSGNNIVKYPSKTVTECKKLCDDEPRCKAFEYGVNYGSVLVYAYEAGDCQLQSSKSKGGCDGGLLNLDLYIKNDAQESAKRRLAREEERTSEIIETLTKLNTAEEFCVFFGAEASICDMPCAEVKHEIEEFLPEGLLDVCVGTGMTISDICSTECAVNAE